MCLMNCKWFMCLGWIASSLCVFDELFVVCVSLMNCRWFMRLGWIVSGLCIWWIVSGLCLGWIVSGLCVLMNCKWLICLMNCWWFMCDELQVVYMFWWILSGLCVFDELWVAYVSGELLMVYLSCKCQRWHLLVMVLVLMSISTVYGFMDCHAQ